MVVTTTQNNGEWAKVCALMLTFIPAIRGEECAGEQQDRREREHFHDLVRPMLCADDQDIERACDPIPHIACGGERSVDSRRECHDRFADASERESGSNSEWLSVANTFGAAKRPSESADATASVTKHLELFFQVLTRVRYRLHVDHIEGLFDLVEGTEVAGYDPLRECREKRRCIEDADFALPFGNVSKVIECSDVGAADGQDPV